MSDKAPEKRTFRIIGPIPPFWKIVPRKTQVTKEIGCPLCGAGYKQVLCIRTFDPLTGITTIRHCNKEEK